MLKKIDPQVNNNFRYLRQYITSPNQVTHNDEVPIMNSCIGLIDAILEGTIVLCAEKPDLDPAPEETPEAAPDETE